MSFGIGSCLSLTSSEFKAQHKKAWDKLRQQFSCGDCGQLAFHRHTQLADVDVNKLCGVVQMHSAFLE